MATIGKCKTVVFMTTDLCGSLPHEAPRCEPLNKHKISVSWERLNAMRLFYVTSFCNFAHRLSDGKPINHECYIIPPKFLEQEIQGESWNGKEHDEWRCRRKIHRGVRMRA